MSLWDSLWCGANVVTCAQNSTTYELITNAALGVHEGKFVFVGAMKDLPKAPEALAQKVIDVTGYCITPGLIDCHTHLVYAGNRAHEFSQRLHGATYQEIAQQGGGIMSTVKATRAANFAELYQQSSQRLKKLIQSGVTTVEIKSGYGLDLENEIKILEVIKALAKEYPITIAPTFLGAHAVPPEYQHQANAYIDEICTHMLPEIAKKNLATAVDAFCETIAFDVAQVERVFKTATALKLKVKLHAEQLSDSKGAVLAAQYQALSADHLEHLDEAGVKAMAAAKMIAVLLPGAFYFLREQKLPPIALLQKYKVPLAFATDSNPGTAPTLSLPLMLNMACVLWRIKPEEALRGVTINAAHALNLSKDYGSIEPNKFADFVVWQVHHPDELCYYFGVNLCQTIVKHGIQVSL